MSSFPALNYLADATRTEGEEKTAFEDLNKAAKQISGSGIAETTLTLATDQVTPPAGGGGIFSIDTEGAAATDNLKNILQTNLPDGSGLLIRCVTSARNVVVKNSAGGAGQISLRTAGDFTLGDPSHWLQLKRTGSLWEEVDRYPEAMPGILTKTANYTTTAADRGKLIDYTSSTSTLSLLPVATAGIGFIQPVRNSGTGIITIDPNAAETIDGAATLTLNAGDKCVIVCDGTNWKTFSRYRASPSIENLSKAIYGFTYANAAVDVTNDIDIAAGGAMDGTGAYWLTGAASTKQLDAAWAVGSGAGGLDTGSIGNSDYYLWVIARSDTGVVDYLFSLSSTAPTMPTNYNFKRLVGWFKRVGGAIVLFHTYETAGGGLELLWDAPTLDINLANTLTTARRTDAVKVPLNFSVVAKLNIVLTDAATPSANWIYCPDQTDAAPSQTVAPLSNFTSIVTGAITTMGTELSVRTSATGTIAARSTLATVDLYAVSTIGFTWARRN